MREVTLAEVLDARDRRAQAQRILSERYGHPLVSFTMNIPGPVKDSPLIRRGFAEGLRLLGQALERAEIETVSPQTVRAVTGNEYLCAVRGDAREIKQLCTRIEDASPLGRLFDMDVIAPDGRKLERGEERRCLVCGAAGRGCASRRVHSLEELSAAVTKLLRQGLLASDAERVDALASMALLDEVYTTPKPGLVDRNNNGSHRDMDPGTFRQSAEALRGYWKGCFLTGAETADASPEAAFAGLKDLGLQAENAMFRATGGVNTHKGAIFTLGTLCGAIGRLWTAEAPCRAFGRICSTAAQLCSSSVEADFTALDRGRAPLTAGERLYLSSGLKGIRGELAAGLPSLLETALTRLEEGLARGLSRNDAGVAALLHLIALGQDSNMIKRGGAKLASAVSEDLRAALVREPFQPLSCAEELDRDFIRQNLSPGGCADLLAAAYFLHDWKET